MGRRPRVTRQEVFRAAREAFALRGYEGTTLAAIGARLGVSPAAVLRHAPDKEALFREAMAAGETDEGLPSDFLAEMPDAENPARALRRLATTLVPYIERKMGENIANFLKARTEEEARTVRLPFDPRHRTSPPARLLAALESYLRRARTGGPVALEGPAGGRARLRGGHPVLCLHAPDCANLPADSAAALPRHADRDLDARRHRLREEAKMKKVLVLLGVLTLLGAGAWWAVASGLFRTDRDLVLSGTIEVRDADVGSLVGGRIAAVRVDEGAAVRKGQVLVEFETDFLDEQIRSQQGRVAAARADLDKALRGPRQEETARARADAENAERERQRLESLLAQGVVGQQAYDVAAATAAGPWRPCGRRSAAAGPRTSRRRAPRSCARRGSSRTSSVSGKI